MKLEKKKHVSFQSMFDNFSTLCMKGLFFRSIPTGNYMFKISNRNTRTRFEICSDLTIKTPEWRHWRRSGVFIVKIEHISHLILVSLWRTLRGKYRLGCLVAITILDPDIPVENHVCGSLLDSVLDPALKTKTLLVRVPWSRRSSYLLRRSQNYCFDLVCLL